MESADTLGIEICNTGEERCAPGHSYGPAVRDCFLIHYVASGQGEFMAGGQRHALHAGQGFLICPGEVTTYRADSREPWHYLWIGYRGSASAELTRMAGISNANPIFDMPDIADTCALLRQAHEDMRRLRLGEVSAAGCLLRLMAKLGEAASARLSDAQSGPLWEYYRRAAWYIEGSLSQGVRVSEVAGYVGLCRSQLYRVFRATAGCTPQQWIQRARLRMAQSLMRTRPELTLAQIAASSGYSGTAQLNDAFRRLERTTPGQYRRKCQE